MQAIQPTLVIALGEIGKAVLRHLVSPLASSDDPQSLLRRIQVVHFEEGEERTWRAYASSLYQFPSQATEEGVTFETIGQYLEDRWHESRTYPGAIVSLAPEMPEQIVHIVGGLGEKICHELLVLCGYWLRLHFTSTHVTPAINLFLVLPDTKDPQQAAYTHAALMELDYFRSRGYYQRRLEGRDVRGYPFDLCWIIEPRNRHGYHARGTEEQAVIVAEALRVFLTPETNQLVHQAHQRSLGMDIRYGIDEEHGEPGKLGAYGSLGIALLELPVNKIREWAAAKLGEELLEEFTVEVSEPPTIKAQVESFAKSHGLEGARNCASLLEEAKTAEGMGNRFDPIAGGWTKIDLENAQERIEEEFQRATGYLTGSFAAQVQQSVEHAEERVGQALDDRVDELVSSPDTRVAGALRFVVRLKEKAAALRMSEKDVRALQRALDKQGYPCRVSGKFDEQTRQAIRDFRRAHGLRPTDLVNTEMWALLDPKTAHSRPPLGLADPSAPPTVEKATFDDQRALKAGKAEIVQQKQELIDSVKEYVGLRREFIDRLRGYLLLALTGFAFGVLLPFLFVNFVLPQVTAESDTVSPGWVLAFIFILFAYIGVLDILVHIRKILQNPREWLRVRVASYLITLLFVLLAFVLISTLQIKFLRKLPGIMRYGSLALIMLSFVYFAGQEFINRAAEAQPMPTWYEWSRHWLVPSILFLLFFALLFSWLPAASLNSLVIPSIDNEVHGVVFVDGNDNGMFEAEEEPFPGVDIALLDMRDKVVSVTQTDELGEFAFSNIMAGTYRVALGAPPNGYRVRSQDQGMSKALQLEGKRLEAPIELGLVSESAPIASLGGIVYEDINQNGVRDQGEPGVPRAKIWLKDENGYMVASTSTDDTGVYSFYGLPSGSRLTDVRKYDLDEPFYTVPEQERAYAYSIILVTPPDYRLMTISPRERLTLNAGQVRADVDFGLTPWPEGFGAVVGRTYHDENDNGRAEPSEAGLPHVILRLERTEDKAVMATTISEEDGYYEFPTVPAGDYTVFEVRPKGWAGLSTVYSANIGVEQSLVLDFDHRSINGSRIYRLHLLSVLSNFLLSLSTESLGMLTVLFFVALVVVTLLLWFLLGLAVHLRMVACRDNYLGAVRSYVNQLANSIVFERAKRILPFVEGQLAQIEEQFIATLQAINEQRKQAANHKKDLRERLRPPSFLFSYMSSDEGNLERLFAEFRPEMSEAIGDLLVAEKALAGWRELATPEAAQALGERVKWYAYRRFAPLLDRTLEEELFANEEDVIADILGRLDASCAIWWDCDPVTLRQIAQETTCSILQSHFNDRLLQFPDWDSTGYNPNENRDPHRLVLFRSAQGLPLYSLASASELCAQYEEWVKQIGNHLPSPWWEFEDGHPLPDYIPEHRKRQEEDPSYRVWVVVKALGLLFHDGKVWWVRELSGEDRRFARRQPDYYVDPSLQEDLRELLVRWERTSKTREREALIEDYLKDNLDSLPDRESAVLQSYLEELGTELED